MDQAKLRAALQHSTLTVLEDSAFTFAEPAPEPPTADAWTSQVVHAELPFTGQGGGRFILAASAELCRSLADEILGGLDDDEPTDDVLGEVLNMVAGMTMEQVADDTSWDLGVPAIRKVEPTEWAAVATSCNAIHLVTDEMEPVDVGVVLAETA